jgi:hypothetical protein
LSIVSDIRSWFTRARPQSQAQPQNTPSIPQNLPGGRASIDTTGTFPTANWLLVPPNNYETNWSLLTVDSKAFEHMNPLKLMEILADLSPEVSRAHWDFLRLCNPGYTVKGFKLKGTEIYKVAQAAIDEFIRVLEVDRKYGSFDIAIGRLNTGTFFRGAVCAELVLDEAGRIPLDMAIPDAASVRFRRRNDPVLGSVWEPGQWQYGKDFVSLDMPTFFYLPIDPMPGVPYGRPLAAPALFVSLFLLGMLHDLKRVIQQQGYPRLDLSIDVAQLALLAPQIASNQTAFNTFVNQTVAAVSSAYSQLKPDDAYIHTSDISVNKPVGAADSGSLQGLDSVIHMLERMCVRALKTMPMALNLEAREGDVQANRQFEFFAAGIRSIQHYAETMLERMFTLALEAQGIQARVEFRFAEFRAGEDVRDAQTAQLQIANEIAKSNAGWISDDEASETITGHKATGTKAVAPQPQPVNNNPGVGNVDGQPTANLTGNNATWIQEVRDARAEVAKAMERVSATNGYH